MAIMCFVSSWIYLHRGSEILTKSEKVYDRLQGEALAALVADMKKNLPELRRTSYGKQVAAIEKLLYPDQDSSSASTSSRNSVQTSTSNTTSAESDRPKIHQAQAR